MAYVRHKGVPIDPAAVLRRIDALAAIGGNAETGGVTRFVYTEPWWSAKKLVTDWMHQMGMATREDAVGNLYGRLIGNEAGPVIMTGSHIDTVIEGGRYDGALGVIASVAATSVLKDFYGNPRRTIEILVTCDEEGGRFHTDFWGARAVTGEILPADADAHIDAEGVTLSEAMRIAGYDPMRVSDARRDDIAAWLELHIEQGSILETESIDIGIVSSIAGHILWEVRVRGREDHAGTTPMDLRRDALAGAVEMINEAVRDVALQGRPAVCTVGQIKVAPGIANVVSGMATFSVDIRDDDADRFEKLLDQIRTRFSDIAARRRLQLEIREFVRRQPVAMDAKLIALLSKAARQQGINMCNMPSMAGHDSEVMAKYWPSAMIFVPSHGGRSHTPAEFTPIDQIIPGVQVLSSALHALAY